jgi:hypothetical protein
VPPAFVTVMQADKRLNDLVYWLLLLTVTAIFPKAIYNKKTTV